MERFLQPNFRNQLRLNFQMAAATDTILELYDNRTVVLRCQIFVDLQQFRTQFDGSLVPFLPFGQNFLVQDFCGLFHDMPLFLQSTVRCLHALFLQPFGLAFLLRLLHELQ